MTDEKTHYNYNTGGMFLLNPIGTTDVFSRENFTEEQSEIEKMTFDIQNGYSFSPFQVNPIYYMFSL